MSRSLVSHLVVGTALLCACGGDSAVEPGVPSPDAGVDMVADAAEDLSGGEDVTIDQPWEPECDLNLPAPGEAHESLSEYCFFGGDLAGHRANDGVVVYDVNATLYADESRKIRMLVVPDGQTIAYDELNRWEFPTGTTIIKTFYYPVDERDPEAGRRILETRLLVRDAGEWRSEIYMWNDEQTEATRDLLGAWRDVDFVDLAGNARSVRYKIPDRNQCKNCHGQNDQVFPLGPSTRQLNRSNTYDGEEKNQIEHLTDLGLFDLDPGDPSELSSLSDPLGDDPLEDRARAYLDANCAHCHNPEGAAGSSGLNLSIYEEEPRDYGVCRRPVAAGGGSGGLFFDIKPGAPDESIMVFRMASEDPELKMPELPTQTSDEIGVQLVRDWISSMPPSNCD